MFRLTGTLIATEGHGDELEAYLLQAADGLQKVPTCHLYIVSRFPDEPDVVHVVELWDDEEAHQASLQLEQVQELISLARPILAGMGDRLEMRPVGGKGIAAHT